MILPLSIRSLAAALLLRTASAAPLSIIATTPLNDDFYHAPHGYEDYAPGSILGSRVPPAGLAAFGLLPIDLASSHQIQYRTTNSLGEPSYSITTVLVPHNANMSRLVSYQDFEDSSWLDCAPSYALQQGSKHSTLLSQANFLYEAGLLNQGFVVSIPDYEGPESAFGSGPQAGQATLDSIRAVLNSGELTGIDKDNVDVVMWGYSGGSIPTEWAAELQPTYAPELKIAGAAVGGTIANLRSVILTINGTASAGFGPAGILGLYQGFKTPELTQLFESEMLDATRGELLKASDQCALINSETFKNKDIGQYFKSGLGFLDLPEIRDLIEKAGIMGKNSVPTIPMYFYKSTEDEIDPVASNDDLVDSYCSKGISSLEYYRNDVSTHSSESFYGGDGAVSFLVDRLEGKSPAQGCHIHNISNKTMNVHGLKGFGSLVVKSITDLAGKPFSSLKDGVDTIKKGINAIKKTWKNVKDFFGGLW